MSVSLSMRMVIVSVPFVISTFAEEPLAGHCVASASVNPINLINSLSVVSSRAVSIEAAGNALPLLNK